jgi:hypothetical protein
MSSASFMWAQEVIGLDHWIFQYLVFSGAGLLMLAVLVLVLRWRGQCDTADGLHTFERAMLASSKLLLPVCGLGCALGMWFWSTKHVYDCGDPVLKFTLVYFDGGAHENATLDWEAACAVFFYSVASLYLVQGFRIRMAALYSEITDGRYTNSINAAADTGFHTVSESVRQAATLKKNLVGLMLYCIVVAGCCAVPFLNVVADYIPSPESTTTWIRPISSITAYVKYSAGILLYVISNLVLPYAARKLSGSPTAGVRWMIFGRLVINQLSTAVFTVLLHQDCYAGWLHYILRDCQNPRSFAVSGQITVSNEGLPFDLPLTITRHEDVCGADASSNSLLGRCMQALVSNISKLLISKLMFTAFVAPCLYLLFCLPYFQRLRYRLVYRLQACVHTYCPCFYCCVRNIPAATAGTLQRSPANLDTELISFIMLLEMAIVYGFAAPAIPLLCLCAVLTHLAAFYFSRVYLKAHFSHHVHPVSDYLIFSFLLSSTLNIAYFWGNADASSKVFVTVSSIFLIVAYLAWIKMESGRADGMASLRAPLLGQEIDGADAPCPVALSVQANAAGGYNMDLEPVYGQFMDLENLLYYISKQVNGQALEPDVAMKQPDGTAEESDAALDHADLVVEASDSNVEQADGTVEGFAADMEQSYRGTKDSGADLKQTDGTVEGSAMAVEQESRSAEESDMALEQEDMTAVESRPAMEQEAGAGMEQLMGSKKSVVRL